MNKNIPAVSIVIPMYNAEKYISECLDSILAQTFDDYEVIIVDNCSTDNSAVVVESYIPKFTAEKLQLVRRKINSGSAAVSRNTGTRLSRGKYIIFMDSDDVIMPDALTELYTTAEKFGVDIVYCEKYYRAPGETVTTDKSQLKEETLQRGGFVSKPTLMSENLAERIKEFYEHKFIALPWNQIIRRDFIVENNIEYPDLRQGEDFVFGFYELCLAEKILRIPYVNYVWRNNPESITWGKLPVDKLIHRWTDSFFRGTEMMDEFMNRFELFNEQPQYRHMVFELTTHYHLCHVVPLYGQIPAGQLEGLIRRELVGVKDKTALTAFLFAQRNIFYVNMLKQQQILQQQQQQIQQLQTQLQAQPSQFQLQTEDIFKA